jgi:predicted small lipoprotein YifL
MKCEQSDCGKLSLNRSYSWQASCWQRCVVNRHSLVAVALAASLTACGSSTPLVAPTPAVTLTTETFTGSVDVMGADFHPFTAAQSGELDITLTVAGPPSTIQMGLGVGVPSGTACALFTGVAGAIVTVAAGTTPQIFGTIAAGPYCVQVFDVGNQAASITYTVTVTHP